jgi:integrase
MRAMRNLIKNEHGWYHAQLRVPEDLQVAVARVLGNGKERQVFLKKALGTKVTSEANVRAKSVLAGFDRTIREAKALLKQPKVPVLLRTTLNDAEIKRMAEYVYAKALAADERFRFGRDEFKRMEAEHIRLEGASALTWATPYDELPPHGLSPTILAENREQLAEDLKDFREYVALGDISAVEEHVSDALDTFHIDLDHKSAAYSTLGTAVLRTYVGALQAIEQRNAGVPVPTPQLVAGTIVAASGTLRDAFEGWKKERARPSGTVHEYNRAVEMFVQLHGNLSLTEIKKSHARYFKEAIQVVPQPRFRSGDLKKASLPELSEWGRKHPEVPKVSAGTINKQLGALQAIAGWGHQNGLIPEEVPWPDPFHKMRVEEEQSSRGPFDARELQKLFDALLFTEHEEPEGAKGAAGAWLPLLALFTGARRGEIAALKVENVSRDEATETPLLFIVADRKAGKRVKTKTSERVVPVHPELVELGFLRYVQDRKRESEHAWLFPAVAPDQGYALSAWGKWWSRYLRETVGIKDTDKVFHSFRHGFQDALRRATPDEELRDALSGRSNAKSVSRTYGAKNMLDRWGVATLSGAISNITYPGLNLSRVRPFRTVKRTRGNK